MVFCWLALSPCNNLVQLLGEELSAILDHQQQLEEQFDKLTLNKSSKYGRSLPQGTQEEIHGLSTSVHGM